MANIVVRLMEAGIAPSLACYVVSARLSAELSRANRAKRLLTEWRGRFRAPRAKRGFSG
jgi:hypothetical protein